MKEARQKRVLTVWIHTENKNESMVIGSKSVVSWGWGRGKDELQRGTKELLEVMEMFIILIVVMISQVYTYVKTDQTVHFNMCKLVYFSYTSIRLKKLPPKSHPLNCFHKCIYSLHIIGPSPNLVHIFILSLGPVGVRGSSCYQLFLLEIPVSQNCDSGNSFAHLTIRPN